MPLSIRSFEARDEEPIVALWKQVFAYTSARNEPRFALRLKRDHDDGLLLVAHQDDTLVGTAMGGYDGHRGWIYSVAVDPERRRAGIGRSLIRELERALTAAGAPKINLQVRQSSVGVIPFYEAIGYRVEPHTSMGKLLMPDP